MNRGASRSTRGKAIGYPLVLHLGVFKSRPASGRVAFVFGFSRNKQHKQGAMAGIRARLWAPATRQRRHTHDRQEFSETPEAVYACQAVISE